MKNFQIMFLPVLVRQHTKYISEIGIHNLVKLT